jgi:hypothetical protein
MEEPVLIHKAYGPKQILMAPFPNCRFDFDSSDKRGWKRFRDSCRTATDIRTQERFEGS